MCACSRTFLLFVFRVVCMFICMSLNLCMSTKILAPRVPVMIIRCMYVCMHLFVCVYRYVCVPQRLICHVCTHIIFFTYAHRVPLCPHTRTPAYLWPSQMICLMHTYKNVCMHTACPYAHTCIHIRTRTRMPILPAAYTHDVFAAKIRTNTDIQRVCLCGWHMI